MKIAIAQQNYHIGNFEDNTRKIIEGIRWAKGKGADLVIFSELCVCGYPPRDFLEFEDFLNRSFNSIDQIKEEADTIAVIVGAPDRNPVREGKDLFNGAFFLYEKQVKAVAHKTCLPNYDVFDEYRYFEPAYHWNIIPFKGKKLALTICEDIWNLGDNPLYRICPMDQLMDQQPDLILNISASPFDYTHVEDRKAILKLNTSKYKLPMIYSNCVGSQTEIVFDGGSLVFDKHSNLVKQLPLFREAYDMVELKDDGTFREAVITKAVDLPDAEFSPAEFDPRLCIAEVHDAIVMGIRNYFTKMGFQKAIIGSSGGVDSAVTLVLACEALGKENVRALLMPSEFSTAHSVADAEKLSQQLGNPYDIIPIREIFAQFLVDLKPVFKNEPFGLAEENVQARIRGNLLMALANKFGYILLNTSNKSELATGYGTLYGDMAGGLSVLGDCYKQQVYRLAEYINRDKERIPKNILVKAPSAELRPGQKDSDSLPDYAILDKILYQYIERRKGPKEIKAAGFDAALVDRVLRLVNINEYKRNQFCPIIRISPKAFGPGRRVPIVGKYLS
jgi:NAD+ synthase (glutamine-hydrolysing)